MTDREKVLTGLKCCANGCLGDCPYFKVDECGQLLSKEALELLKEQETAKAALKVLSDRQCEVSPHHYERKGFCPKCHQEIRLLLNRNYCGFCGQAVKWG